MLAILNNWALNPLILVVPMAGGIGSIIRQHLHAGGPRLTAEFYRWALFFGTIVVLLEALFVCRVGNRILLDVAALGVDILAIILLVPSARSSKSEGIGSPSQ